MNVDKAELKILIANDIGASTEDMYESAKNLVHHWDGASKAFSKAAAACTALAEHVNKDIDDGLYDLETAKHIKRYIERCAHVNQNLQRQAEDSMMATTGKVTAFETVVGFIKKYQDAEKLKIAAVRVEQGPNATTSSAPAIRPISLKEQRLAEAVQETQETEKPIEIKRRGRPPKSKQAS